MSQYPRFSVIIISASRRKHLFWSLKACMQSRVHPTEILIVHMDDLHDFYTRYSSVKQYRISRKSGKLDLAGARNLGARKAITDNLIFLDVDCIPDRYCFERILHMLSHTEVVQGTPKYLTRAVKNLNRISSKSITHPLKPSLHLPKYEEDYNQFWSLIFGIKKKDFFAVDGFSESYRGYGAEDTDLGQKFKYHDMEMYRTDAMVYHQYHKVFRPPLNHFEGIINNAQIFKERWGFFPMMNWINSFIEKKLVEIKDGNLNILRFPSQSEIMEAGSTKAF